MPIAPPESLQPFPVRARGAIAGAPATVGDAHGPLRRLDAEQPRLFDRVGSRSHRPGVGPGANCTVGGGTSDQDRRRTRSRRRRPRSMSWCRQTSISPLQPPVPSRACAVISTLGGAWRAHGAASSGPLPPPRATPRPSTTSPPALRAADAPLARATPHIRRIARQVPSREPRVPRERPRYADQPTYKLARRKDSRQEATL